MRERLIEWLKDNRYLDVLDEENWAKAAELLIDNGVIAPPVKAGDVVWAIEDDNETITRIEIVEVHATVSSVTKFHFLGVTEECDEDWLWDWEFGEYIFTTKEEAERALAERSEE